MKRLDEEAFTRLRQRMVSSQLRTRGIHDERVLTAMERVPRHRFVPLEMQPYAYEDRPLPIGLEQTISQPFVVALMIQLAAPSSQARVLDVGTGSGYQAAVLAELCREVFSIEVLPALADQAEQLLCALGYDNVRVTCGDAHHGWAQHAPFDAIVSAAAPHDVPQALIDQLNIGGRLVMPVGERDYQELVLVEKLSDGRQRRESHGGVSFVPMVGRS